MQPSILAAFGSLLAVLLWWSSRRRPAPLLSSTDTQAVAALNRAQIALVQQGASAAASARAAAVVLPAPGDARARQALLARLRADLSGDPRLRRAAIELASHWGDRATLPLLQRGLRDVDPAVVQVAAMAMQRFRGRSAAPYSSADQALAPLPRNVVRTR